MNIEEYITLLRVNPNNYPQGIGHLFEETTNKVCALGLLLTEQDGSFCKLSALPGAFVWMPRPKPGENPQYQSEYEIFKYLEKPDNISCKDWNSFLISLIEQNDTYAMTFTQIADWIERWIEIHNTH